MEFYKRTLSNTENEKVFTANGEYLGEIVEIRNDEDPDTAEYIILRHQNLTGGDQYFAIPACRELLQMNELGNVICNVDRTDLDIAVDIEAKSCPKRNPDFSQTIFELHGYT